MYLRCWVFPQLIYQCVFDMSYTFFGDHMRLEVVPFFGILLCSLQLLHFYWTFLMFKILYNFVFKGVAEDIVDK
jgi:hypothetical protein